MGAGPPAILLELAAKFGLAGTCRGLLFSNGLAQAYLLSPSASAGKPRGIRSNCGSPQGELRQLSRTLASSSLSLSVSPSLISHSPLSAAAAPRQRGVQVAKLPPRPPAPSPQAATARRTQSCSRRLAAQEQCFPLILPARPRHPPGDPLAAACTRPFRPPRWRVSAPSAPSAPPPPPSCSPRRPLTHSGDAELRKIRGSALPPYLPALRAGHFPPSLPCSPRGYPRICARVVPCAPSRSTVASDSWRRHALRTHTVLVAPGHQIFAFPASLCLHGSRTGMSATGCQASIGCLDPA